MLDVTTRAGAAALSAEQKAHWDRHGYLILPQFFGAEIVDPVNALRYDLATIVTLILNSPNWIQR